MPFLGKWKTSNVSALKKNQLLISEVEKSTTNTFKSLLSQAVFQ